MCVCVCLGLGVISSLNRFSSHIYHQLVKNNVIIIILHFTTFLFEDSIYQLFTRPLLFVGVKSCGTAVSTKPIMTVNSVVKCKLANDGVINANNL